LADVGRLIMQVLPAADSDAEELADLAEGLRAELLDVDAASVAPLTAEAAPEGAKGPGDLAGCWFSSGPWTGCGPWWPPCADTDRVIQRVITRSLRSRPQPAGTAGTGSSMWCRWR